MPSPSATTSQNEMCSSVSSAKAVSFPVPRKVVYIYDALLGQCTDRISHIRDRSGMTHELIDKYGLTRLMSCKSGKLATREQLLQFHSQEYVDFLLDADKYLQNSSLTEDEEEEEEPATASVILKYGMTSGGGGGGGNESLEQFGLGYDCPVFKDLGSFALRVAGASLTAAEELVQGSAEVAINWCGGWHHAQRGEASGFCYVNDIVLAIHQLQHRFQRILYVDLDAHHGDGVENAFSFSSKVMTLSFHHLEAGYFPGTGATGEKGKGRGKYYAVNVPLRAGVTDSQFTFLFDSVFEMTARNFQPDCLVVQCGADGLARDPLGAFNLTLEGVAHCVKSLLDKKLPALLLGGGGYNVANAARLWTRLTAEAVGRKLENDLPDNAFFLKYGPDFELGIEPSLRKNENDEDYINELIETVSDHFVALKKRKEATA